MLQAIDLAGCSRTPPHLRTADSAALKHPPSSPTFAPHRRSFMRAIPHHRPHGGCASTGSEPVYLRASRFSSQQSTPAIFGYGPFVSTYKAAMLIIGC